MRLPPFLCRDIVMVKAYLGESAYGPRYATAYKDRCRMEVSSKLHRQETNRDTNKSEVTKLGTAYFMPTSQKVAPQSIISWQGYDYTVEHIIPRTGFANKVSYYEAVLV